MKQESKETPEPARVVKTVDADSPLAGDSSSTNNMAPQEKDDLAMAGSSQQAMSRFLLVGCERSGTTMLRLMLDHHPELTCLYESDYMVQHYRQCHGRPPRYFARLLQDDWHFRNSGLRFPDDAESYEEAVSDFFRQRGHTSGTRIVGATIHRSYAEVPSVFPDAQYIHIIRDGRPVAASIMRMGWTGNVYFGALRWQQKLVELEVLEKRIPSSRWLSIRYEDLVATPDTVLERICQFLNVDYSPEMVRYNKDSTYDKPDAGNADRWRSVLSPKQIHQVEMAAGETLERNGYAREFPPDQPSLWERLLLRLHNRIARGVFNCRRFSTYLVLARKFWRLIGLPRESLERRYRAIYEAHFK